MEIIKENGEQEEFDPEKLQQSLTRAGAKPDVVDHIVSHILEELREGMTTTDIYQHAFTLLKKGSDMPIAARYSLKRAIMGLGPAGFAFESLIAEIYKVKGYTTATGIHMRGKCADHEIDMVATKDDALIVVEAKFHNRSGFKTDLKTALYVEARWRDLQATAFGGHLKEGMRAEFILFTNTKFTNNAIKFAMCSGLGLVGWAYPTENSLEHLIEKTGVQPLSCLTTLKETEKQALFRDGVVLCRDIKGNPDRLKAVGLDKDKSDTVLREAELICVPEHH